MWHGSHRGVFLAFGLGAMALVCTGCDRLWGQAEPGANTSPAQTLCAADLDRFLAVVQSNADAMIPEFEPPEEVAELNYGRPARDLVEECRRQFGHVFDIERQARIWQNEERWSRAFAKHSVSADEFAQLVLRVSCAVMRVRIDARVELERVIDSARHEAAEICETMDAIDDIPESERGQSDLFIRGQSALRLARLTALIEFAEMVRQAPDEDCALVRKYAAKLKPLLPSGSSDDLLAELKALAEPRTEIVPAGFERPTK